MDQLDLVLSAAMREIQRSRPEEVQAEPTVDDLMGLWSDPSMGTMTTQELLARRNEW